MAQDFRAAFGVGEDARFSSRWSARRAERSPGSRAFNALVRAKDAQIESLPREMDDVRAEVSRIAAPAQAQASR
jgi:hypothetical protein